MVQSSDSTADLWHKRYGHLSFTSMNKLARKDLVTDFGYKTNSSNGFCEACVEGKQTRNSFKAKDGIASTELLELIHSDVCGKMGVPSLSGSEYVVTFVDDKSRYMWCYPIKKKSDDFRKFKEWRAWQKNHVELVLKLLELIKEESAHHMSLKAFSKMKVLDMSIQFRKHLNKMVSQKG